MKVLNPELAGKIDKALSGEEALCYLLGNIRVEPEPLIQKSVEKSKVTDETIDKFIAEKKRLIEQGQEIGCNYGIIFTDCSMPFMDGY